MTPVRNRPPWPVLTGLALAVTGALVAALGHLGENWAHQRARNVRSETAGRTYEKRTDIIESQYQRLRDRLQALPELELMVTGETATGPAIDHPDTLDVVLSSGLQAGADRLKEAFPDQDFVGRARLYLTRLGPGSTEPAPQSGWSASSEGVVEDVESSPGVHRFFGLGEEVYPLIFNLPRRGEMRTAAYDAIERFFLDQAITRRDRAGNQSPTGVRGILQVSFSGSEGPQITTAWTGVEMLFKRLSQLGLLFLVLAPPVWVFLDARRKRLPASLWGLFVLPTSLIGLLVYALANRETGPACPECGERVSPRFSVCPYCRTELKGTCPTCGQTIGLNWHYCPSCSTEL